MRKEKLSALATLAFMTALVLISGAAAYAQQTTGNVRGIVTDQTGAVVPNVKVTITSKATNNSLTTQSTAEGEYQINNLLAGDYTITVEASNFKMLTLNDVRVKLNDTTDVPAQLSVGIQGETIEVSAGGAELVNTTTINLSKQFNERQAIELAQTGSTGNNGVNNLALIAPNVSSSGGVGVGVGGSVGGQRPRNNNFVVDGIDNNDKSLTGPQIYVSPETVAEFSLLANQYSAEFARSTGGQFITVTKSGTNEFHGTGYEFFRNRKLNALDTLDKLANIVREDNVPGRERQRRYDYNRYGFNIGGPVYLPRFGEGGKSVFNGKNKLFFFSSYELLRYAFNNGAGSLAAPTAAGLARIATLPGISQTNFSIFRQFVPVASVNDQGTINVAGADIPIGSVSVPSPFTQRQRNFVLNLDYTQTEKTQHRSRFIYNRNRQIDNLATFPQFFTDLPQDGRLFSYTLTHQFKPNLSNELRLAYRRYTQFYVVPNFQFPGLDQFPNITLEDLGGTAFNIGPDPNAPQFNIENNYQVVDNVTYLAGNHSMKFGGDFRKLISPQSFVQRQRGDYDYNTTDFFLRDISPDSLGERSVGASPYQGNQKLLFLFAQDDWRARPNLTFNLGLNYVYQELPFSARQQGVNSVASIPGLLEFRAPKAQKKKLCAARRLAYSPDYKSGLLGRVFGTSGQSSIRASFQMAYDVIFDNLYILTLPPQFNQTVDVDTTTPTPNFLRNGGISPNPVPTGNISATDARLATSAFIPDQKVPYSVSYSLSYQRQFLKDYALEVRYLGTRGIHLLTQSRLNRQPQVTNSNFIPTLFAASTAAQLQGFSTLGNVRAAQSSFVPAFAAAGFTQNNITSYQSNGSSTYQGGSIQLTRRFTRGLQGSAAYTYSHLIDDSTAEVFSTVLTPRRPQDFQNLRADRSDSALDRRHRFVLSSLYDLPFFNRSSNKLARTLFGGFSFAGTLTFESGEKATVLSGVDSNLNGDRFPDRTIINTNGARNTVSPVYAVNASGQRIVDPDTGQDVLTSNSTVAFVAINPNAQYIQAGPGALANSGRNTLQLPGINNLDFSVFKNFLLTENKRFQLRADFFNIFNHPQYTPGSVNAVDLTNTTGVSQVNTIVPGNTDFNRPGNVFSSHSRIVQLGLRFSF